MTRIALQIEYSGENYSGWQSQKNLSTIQGFIEEALSRVGNEKITVQCAGRTDAGVHAVGQVIHFDTTAKRTLYAWKQGGNTYLPNNIVISNACEVDENFHARFSAQSRRYCYVIYNNPNASAIFSKKVTWYAYPLDESKMHLAAQSLLGEHDFTSFRSTQCESKTPMRRIIDISVQRAGQFVFIEIEANAFLHHMVRNITGTLIKIGFGSLEPGEMAKILHEKDRTKAFETAPPDGLYLIDVRYPLWDLFPKKTNPFCQ